MHRIFDVALDSEVDLPELPRHPGPSKDLRVYRFEFGRESGRSAHSAEVEWFHDWVDPRGRVTIRGGRYQGLHWLRFPHLADFEIDLSRHLIRVYPEPIANEATLRHLLLDQVVPRVLGQEGALVLHAGAVTLTSGKTLAFIGQSGWGKSTLVSAFKESGAQLISDDCLLLKQEGAEIAVISNYPGVRLNEDSIQAIYGADAGGIRVAQNTAKKRIHLPGADAAMDECRLDALFLLGDPTEAVDGEMAIRQVADAEVMIRLVRESFILDPTDKSLLTKWFRAVGGLLDSDVKLFELDYSRDYARLHELRTAIERAVA